MKRRTLIEYSKVIIMSLVITVVTAAFGFIQFLFEDTERSEAASAIPTFPVTIIIDPGHGGEDGGAVGAAGSFEKDINLAVSKYLSDFLSSVDLNVILTRTSDTMLYKDGQQSRKKFYDLHNRVEMCRTNPDALVISIHQNKFPIAKYSGLQVYYSKNHTSSRIFAEIVQGNTKKYLQRDNERKIKEAGKNIFLLDKLECPAVIVECGFLSNPEEEKLLCSSDYQRKLAFVIFSSVMDYINIDV